SARCATAEGRAKYQLSIVLLELCDRHPRQVLQYRPVVRSTFVVVTVIRNTHKGVSLMLRIAGAFAVLACEILLPLPVAAADEDLRAILRAQQAEIDTLKQELERLKGAPSALSKDLPDAPAIEATPNASAASPAPASHPG